jgi:diacylglycerol O-acyltransferase / wax synthase
MWFLLGLPDNRIGWFVRVHHVIADGIAGAAELGVLLDPISSSAIPPLQPWIPAPQPSERALFLDNLQGHIAKLSALLPQLHHRNCGEGLRDRADPKDRVLDHWRR